MEVIFWLILLLALVWGVAYLRWPIMIWTIAIAVYLEAWTYLYQPSTISLVLVWLLFAALVIPLNIPPLRRRLVNDRILTLFRHLMPKMSQTEKEALEAGTVWWDGDLFSGNPDWKRLLSFPVPTLTEEEQAFIDGPTDELCHLLDDWEINEKYHDLPPEVWQFIKEKGFFGMIIPKEYGGLEFSALAHSSVVMKISTRSIVAGITVMVPNSLGPAELLLNYGTDEQKQYYLPRLARGEEVPCFALTGPEAGSDAGAMPDRGEVCMGAFKGERVLGIRLNWEKRYITLGPVATVLGLAFKLYDPEGLLGDEEELGITVALIPTDTDGVTIGSRHAPLSVAFQNGPNWGHDVFIPMDWVIGGAERVGQGWRMLMESLAAGRSISLPATGTGAAKMASRATGAYARIRYQFKLPIGKFEGVEEALTRIAASTYMADAARIMTAGAVDQGEKPSVISAIVKYNLTETMRRVLNDAMDVQGGSGISMGPRNLLGRAYQGVPVSITVEGANILTRTLIIFGQGAVRCHPYVLKEMMAVNNPDHDEASRDFDKAITGHIGFTISNIMRALWLGLSGARFVRTPGGPQTRIYYQQLTRMSAVFAMTADLAMFVLGGALKRKEKLSGRLADVLSHLYLASAVLKRFEDQGRPEADLPLVRWCCEYSLHMIQQQLSEFFRNMPNRIVAWKLRAWAFPLGQHFAMPSDELGHEVAVLIQSPSEARDRLTAGIFLSDDDSDRMGLIDNTLQKVIENETLATQLREAVQQGKLDQASEADMIEQALARQLISAEEAVRYQDMLDARKEVIKVDDFPQDYWTNSGTNNGE